MSDIVTINKNNKTKKAKKSFKMPSSLVIILGVLFFVIFLSWILQNRQVDVILDGSDISVTVHAIGLFSFGNLIVEGFANASAVIFYLFSIGWFLDLMLKSGSLEIGIKSLIKGLSGKELLLVPIMFYLFAFGGTAFGMQEETLGLVTIIVPFFLLAGFDTVTGILIMLLGTTTGIASSIVDPFSIGTAFDSIPTDIVGNYTLGDGIALRFVTFIIFSSIGASFVTFYAWKVQKNNELSLMYNTRDNDLKWAKETFEKENSNDQTKMDKKHKWALIIFAITFLMMFLMLLPWTALLKNVPDMDNLPVWISWLFNGFAFPGNWGFGELIVLFTISSLILSAIFKLKGSQILESFWSGAKDMLVVSILIAIARSIPQALATSHLDMYFALNITDNLNNVSPMAWIYIMFFVFMLFSLFIPSTSGLASVTMNLFSTSAYLMFKDSGNDHFAIISTVLSYAIAIGIVNMFTPTQAVVMASAERSRIPYKTMLKPIMIYSGMLIFVTLVVIFPLTLVFYK